MGWLRNAFRLRPSSGLIMVRHGGRVWAKVPHVRTGSSLSVGERASDVLKNVFGTWTLLGLIAGFLIFYLLTVHDTGELHLNLGLSCMAAVQGIILQIAANRIDRTNAEAQLHHVQQTQRINDLTNQIKHLINENTALTKAVKDTIDLLNGKADQ